MYLGSASKCFQPEIEAVIKYKWLMLWMDENVISGVHACAEDGIGSINLSCFRLWFHVRFGKEKHNHLFIGNCPSIDAAMDSRLGRIPICHSRMDGESLDLA